MNFASRLLDPQRRAVLARFCKSGRCTPVLVGLLCLLLVGASLEFGHGHLHLLTAKISPPVAIPQYPTGPGGQDILRLSRTGAANGEDPEFLSVTLFPGHGMTVYQITARIPGRGDVSLLASSPLNSVMNAVDGNADGALLLPWARHLTGTAVTGSAGDSMVQTAWQGLQIRVPADPPGSSSSVQGLLFRRGADSMQTQQLPDGQSVTAVFGPSSFAGDWPSSLQVAVQVELEAHNLVLTMTARNVGLQPIPLGFGWQPKFSLPGGNSNGALLTIPSTMVAETDPATSLPTGRTVSVAHTKLDFSSPDGAHLDDNAVDETYTDLSGSPDGPTAELRDPANDLRLRLVAITPNITNMHVIAPQDASWVSIDPNTNLDDPLGPEWTQRPNGLTALSPGKSMQWKVRLEISRLDAIDQSK
jgi:galactose mutarotase-like enzyme